MRRSAIPVLLVERDRLPAETAALLASDVAVTLVASEGAVAAAVAEEMRGTSAALTHVGGASPAATSAAAAVHARARGVGGETAWLATVAAFPDALVAGAAAGRDDGVLLLVDGTDLDATPAARDYLEEHARDLRTVRLAGGEAAISSHAEDQIRAIMGG